uniref:Golgin A7 family member B n=2 Tax=Passeriformes TaxID=9126 RepID=A0A8U7MPK4_CORMO
MFARALIAAPAATPSKTNSFRRGPLARRSASPTVDSPNPCRAIPTAAQTLCYLRQHALGSQVSPQGPTAASQRCPGCGTRRARPPGRTAAALPRSPSPGPAPGQPVPPSAATGPRPPGAPCRWRQAPIRGASGRAARTGRLRTRGGRARLRLPARQHRGQRPAPRGSARPRRRRRSGPVRSGPVPPARHGTARPGARRVMATEVHSLQELRRSASLATKVFVQRDYSDGTTCQFQTKFPPELESRIERQLFEETVKTLNGFYAEAEKIGGSSYLEGCLACATAYFIFLCMETHYEKVLKKISKYIQDQNEKIYAPRGLLLTDPLERGMRVIEISIYEDRCSSGSSSSGSSSSSSGGGGAGGR